MSDEPASNLKFEIGHVRFIVPTGGTMDCADAGRIPLSRFEKIVADLAPKEMK